MVNIKEIAQPYNPKDERDLEKWSSTQKKPSVCSMCFFLSENKMGRRKKARKAPPKKKNVEPLDSQFNCPFCNHEKSCECKM